MKKVFTLMASVMLTAAAFAQSGHSSQKYNGYDNGREVVYNNGPSKNDFRKNDYYSFSIRERDQAIAQINREYDRKIQQAKFKMFISPFRKAGIIRQLEAERSHEIGMVYAKFNSPKNVFGDNRGRNDHYGKNDRRY